MNTQHIPLSARNKNLDHMKLLITDHGFQGEVMRIRKEYPRSSDKSEEYASEVTQLCRSKRLPSNFDSYVHRYIAYGFIHAPMTNFNIIPNVDRCSEVTIKIYVNLTEAEIKDMHKEINRTTELISYQPLKDIDRRIEDEMIYDEVRRQNENPNKEYTQTVAELVGKKRIKKVYENARELKELRKKRFGN